jgi:hypothetical protein
LAIVFVENGGKGMDDKVETTAWDVIEHWENEADMVAYWEAALETNDPALIAAARADIARACAQKPHLLAYSGTVIWAQDALAYQQALRDEWT